MSDNLKRLVKALKSTGFDVEVCEDWDKEYCLMTISNPNQDDDYYQLCFNKQTGRYASYINGSYFVTA